MSTTSYTWNPLTYVATVNNVVTAGDQNEAAIAANAAGTLYMTAWTSDSTTRSAGTVLRARARLTERWTS